ncbi:MAG: hypothetical protein ACK54L_17545, partial [Betaproteobacteria bacterium]
MALLGQQLKAAPLAGGKLPLELRLLGLQAAQSIAFGGKLLGRLRALKARHGARLSGVAIEGLVALLVRRLRRCRHNPLLSTACARRCLVDHAGGGVTADERLRGDRERRDGEQQSNKSHGQSSGVG